MKEKKTWQTISWFDRVSFLENENKKTYKKNSFS